MSDQTRTYVKSRRAELEAETRERITASLVALHGTVGPSRTTVSAVAEHAGVRRSTVYRHFADERAMLAACSAHWAAANPLPRLDEWARVADPDERTRIALAELYGFYARTEGMLANLLRDEPLVPAVAETFQGFRAYLAAGRDVLLRGRRVRGAARRRCAAALAHAVAFPTWRSLVREQGLSEQDAVALMADLANGR